MRRREFVGLLGGAAAFRPLAGLAQQAGKLPVVGFLAVGTPATFVKWIAAFTKRLHELGWAEGRTIAIEYRFAEGHIEQYVKFAAEFVRLQVDLIVTAGGATSAVEQLTSTIPIIFAAASDPVGSGLVASLARPGGNITGSSLEAPDLSGKRLEILRQVVPNLHRLAIMFNAGYRASVLELNEVQTAASTLGLEAVASKITRGEDIEPAFDSFRNRADALYVVTDPLTSTHRSRINALALGAGLPTMHGIREFVETGGLMSYGASFADLYARAADFSDRILRGKKPGDIPVEQPTKFELVISRATAKALGLRVPTTLLATADEIID